MKHIWEGGQRGEVWFFVLVAFIELAISLPFELLLLVVACVLTAAVAVAFVLLPFAAPLFAILFGRRATGSAEDASSSSSSTVPVVCFLFSFSARS